MLLVSFVHFLSVTAHFLCAGEGVVPEPEDQTQAPEAGGGVSGGGTEKEEQQPACEPLEGSDTAASRGRRGGHHQR